MAVGLPGTALFLLPVSNNRGGVVTGPAGGV